MAFRIVFLAVGLWENSALESRILSSGSMGSLDLSEIQATGFLKPMHVFLSCIFLYRMFYDAVLSENITCKLHTLILIFPPLGSKSDTQGGICFSDEAISY